MNPLAGKVALVTGATRAAGRGIAVELGAAGATVYVTGRSTRAARSEMDRPETIEDTAELVDAAGGRGIAVPVDHLDPQQVRDLIDRIEREQGSLHILVNDIWGQHSEPEWDKTVWESDLEGGLRLLQLGIHTHAITSHYALPLLIKSPGGLVIEMTDGTNDYNADHYRVSFFYDVAKGAVSRMAFALARELDQYDATAVLLTPGWLRSEAMLDGFGVTRGELARRDRADPTLRDLREPVVRRPRGGGPRRGSRRTPVERQVHVQRRTRPALRLHRSRRQPPRRVALHRRGPGPRQASRHRRLPLTPTACTAGTPHRRRPPRRPAEHHPTVPRADAACRERDPESGRHREHLPSRRHGHCRIPLVHIGELRPPSLRRMHQHITTKHRPRGHHRLMPRRMPRRRHQPHPMQRGLPIHHPQLPRVHNRPNHPLVRRPAPHVLDLIPLHHILRIPKPRHRPIRSPPDMIQMHMRQHHRVNLISPNPSHLQQPRQPPHHPQPLSRLPTRRPHSRIHQHNPRIPSHQEAVKMQQPPRLTNVPRHYSSGPLSMLRTPLRQRLLDVFRKHRHRITQHRHVHPEPPLNPTHGCSANQPLGKPSS